MNSSQGSIAKIKRKVVVNNHQMTQLNNQLAEQTQKIIYDVEQQLYLPVKLYDKAIKKFQNYQKLRKIHQKQLKINSFKDQLIQKIIVLFQNTQNKIIHKLHALEEVNIKYIKKYRQAKNKIKKTSKNSNNMSMNLNNNLSVSLDSSISQNRQQFKQDSYIKQNQRQLKKDQDNFQQLQIQLTQSIFQSEDWLRLIKQSELKLNEIENAKNNQNLIQNQQEEKNRNQRQNQKSQFYSSLLKGIRKYCFASQNQLKIQNFDHFKIVKQLIDKKKIQIYENDSLKRNIQLNSQLQKLNKLRSKIQKFFSYFQLEYKGLQSGNSTVADISSLQRLLGLKIEIEDQLDEAISAAQDIQAFNKNQKIMFKLFTEQLFNSISDQSSVLHPTLNMEQLNQFDQLTPNYQHIEYKTIQQKFIQQKQKAQKQLNQKLDSLKHHLKSLCQQSQKTKQQNNSLRNQNKSITQKLENLQGMKNKYEFYISKQQEFFDAQRQNSNQQNNRLRQKVDMMLQKSAIEQEKQLLYKCLQQKDELLKAQEQELKQTKQQVIKVKQKIKQYFESQGVQIPPQSYSSSSQFSFNFTQLFETYSKQVTKQAYQRYPQQKQQITKNLQSKYKKIVQVQREEYEERIQTLKQELKLAQLQKQSYKSSLNRQANQLTKMKTMSDKIYSKKLDLQMQNSKSQQILKNVLDMMFAYLMSNISYENLLQQIQSTIENIKNCLKYRQKQRERERENKDLPPITDYRFSGLSAVSNDFSFSKLNKQSYCDYFNQQSQVDIQSEVISKISSQDQILPPSRPSYSVINAQKRHMGLIDINQRATTHQDDSFLGGLLNPMQIRTPQRNYVLLDGLQDEYIRSLESKFGYLQTRIPQQTIEVQRQVQADAKQMYIKYKQALVCLQEAQKINKQNELQYQNFFEQLKQQGILQNKERLQKKLFYLSKKIKQQQRMIEQQKIQFQTTIASQVQQSQKAMDLFIKNLNKSLNNNS